MHQLSDLLNSVNENNLNTMSNITENQHYSVCNKNGSALTSDQADQLTRISNKLGLLYGYDPTIFFFIEDDELIARLNAIAFIGHGYSVYRYNRVTGTSEPFQ